MDLRALKTSSHYRIIIAICLFLVLDCSILAINFYITVSVDQDARAINISGRQRMLSQRLTKTLLTLEKNPQHHELYIQELKLVHFLFSSTLDAFDRGGIVQGTNGEQYQFTAINDVVAQRYLAQTKTLFAPISEPVKALTEIGFSPLLLEQALSAALANNLEILTLTNSLTSRMEELSKQKTLSLRWMQTIAFVFALLNFIAIIQIYQKRSQHAERQVKNFLSLVDSAAISIIVMDSQRRIILANMMAQEFFGYDNDVFIEMAESELLSQEGEEWLARNYEGRQLPVAVVEKSFSIHNNDLITLTVTDISRFKQEHQELAFWANHDALTGLVNRKALFERLNLEIVHAKRSGNIVAVLFLDLNGFKPVNDNFGHALGDILLKQLAKRLNHTVRETDTVSRYGGDEFVVVLTDVNSPDYLDQCFNRLKSVFDRPFDIEGHTISLGCSIGTALYPDDASHAGELIELADARMYAMKQPRSGVESLS